MYNIFRRAGNSIYLIVKHQKENFRILELQIFNKNQYFRPALKQTFKQL